MLDPRAGKSPGEANGNPLQYSCLENSIDRGAWWATVHGLQRVGHNWLTNTLQGEGKGHIFKLMASTQCNMRQNDLQIEGSREWGLEGGGECLWHLLQGPFPKESRTGRSQTWRNRLLIFSISLPLYAFSFWHFSAYWSLFQSEQRKKMEIGNQMLQVVLNGHSLKFLLKLWRGGVVEKGMGTKKWVLDHSLLDSVIHFSPSWSLEHGCWFNYLSRA